MLIFTQGWRQRAACKNADPNIFLPGDSFDEEEDEQEPSAEALYYCDQCPVKADCLTEALVTGQQGIWGGTTSYQRRQLKRPLARITCPVCGAQTMKALDVITSVEFCVACGASWRLPGSIS